MSFEAKLGLASNVLSEDAPHAAAHAYKEEGAAAAATFHF